MADKRKAGIAVAGVVLGTIGIVAIARAARAAPPIPPADIILSNIVIVPAQVYVGEPVTISVAVSNIGGTAGSYEVICEVIGMVEKRKTVTLNPGESKVVSFAHTFGVGDGTPGGRSYSISADGQTGNVLVFEEFPANFEVDHLSINPSQLYVGETVAISVIVTNVGGTAGSYEVVLNIT